MNPLQLFNLLSKAKDPMNLLQQMSSNNLQLKRVLEVINGKSPQELRQYVENTAKTQGVDLNQLAQKLGLQIPQ